MIRSAVLPHRAPTGISPTRRASGSGVYIYIDIYRYIDVYYIHTYIHTYLNNTLRRAPSQGSHRYLSDAPRVMQWGVYIYVYI